MQAHYFVGLDIAAETFTVAVGTSPWKLQVAATEFANDAEGLLAFGAWLQRYQLLPAQTICCMEATGTYGELVGYWLVAQGYRLAVEPPLKVKRAFQPQGPKTDAVDSQQIAEYACRFADELAFWQPRPETLEQLRVLLATREQLVVQKTAQQNALKALQHKVVATPLAEQVHRELIAHFQAQILVLERELRRLLDQDPTFRRMLLLLLTVPGVGLLLAAHLIVLASSTAEPLEAKSLAAYIGIAPLEKRSGKTVRGRSHSRGQGPSMLRKLLHLAARSVATHHASFRQYYLRKRAEGKLAAVALNNVANKLLKVICAVWRSQTAYIPNYKSIHPALLQAA